MPAASPGNHETLTVRIPGALKARLLDLASANDVPAGQYVTEALEQWFAARSFTPAPASAPQPDEAAPSRIELGAPLLIDWDARSQPEGIDDGELTVREGPVEYEGVILRAVEIDGIVRTEVWGPDGWTRGGSLEDILWGTPLAPEQLDEAGNPK